MYRDAVNNSDRVIVFDTTLRDGEQSPGVSLTVEDKLAIAQQLERLGVDVVEAGFPAVSPDEFAAVQGIARTLDGPVVAAFARARRNDLDLACEAVKDAKHPCVHVSLSTSDLHIKHQLRSSREEVKRQVRSAVAHAKQSVEDIEFGAMDASRADIEFTAEVCQIAIDAGATRIDIPDTVGYALPHEFAAHIQRLQEFAPGLHDVLLAVHCHNDLGLAVSNTLAGLMAGARQVECTINGIGERAGNTSLEEIVMLLHTRADQVGLYTDINTRELIRTSRLVSRLTKYDVQPNKAVVGRNAFTHESGIHQDGVLKERTTFEVMDPTSVGLDGSSIVLGKHSGRHALRRMLVDAGHKADGQALERAFARFKQIAHRAGEYTTAELVALVTDPAPTPVRALESPAI